MIREDLRAEVLAHGFSSVNYADRINRWASEAQQRVYRQAAIRTAELSTTFTTIPGDPAYSIPADFSELISLFDVTNDPPVEIIALPDKDEFDYQGQAQGTPVYFRAISTAFYFAPIPDNVYSIKLRYWALPENVTSDGIAYSLPDDYCYLLEEYCLYKAYASEGDVEMSNFHKNIFETDLVQLTVDLQHDTDERPKVVQGGWSMGYP